MKLKILYGAVATVVIVVAAAAMAAGQSSSPARDSGGNDLLSCSPAPCVLPPTQASEGGAEVTDTPIVADPLNPLRLLLGSVDDNCPPPGASGFHLSRDGGSTWSVACMTDIRNGRLYVPGGQPMVGYDLDGTAYIADEFGDSEGLGFGLIGFEKSTDGINWSQPTIAMSEGYSELLYASIAVDANALSPYVNSVYISAVILDEPGQNRTQVAVSYTHDGGKTWTLAAVDPQQTHPAEDDYTNISVGTDGTVYLTWQHCQGTFAGSEAGCKNGRAYMVFSKSSDGGHTWSRPGLVTAVDLNNADCHCPAGTLPNSSDIAVYNYPAIKSDNSGGPYSGNLYTVMYDWTGAYMRVQVIRSTDGGNTWSKPVYVAPPSDTHDQFFPWLSVSPTGLVGVSWLDRRNDPANIDYQAFAAISTDGGRSFQPNVQLTSSFSDPNVGGEVWMGDYSGNTWDGPNYFIAAWMDSSNGVDMQEEVGGIRLK
jgi:hypothetical protein